MSSHLALRIGLLHSCLAAARPPGPCQLLGHALERWLVLPCFATEITARSGFGAQLISFPLCVKCGLLACAGADPEEAFVKGMRSLMLSPFTPIKDVWSVLTAANNVMARGPTGV
jgi:hypothetical protein